MKKSDLKTLLSTEIARDLNSLYQDNGLSISCKTREALTAQIVKSVFGVIETNSNNINRSGETPFTSLRNKLSPFKNLLAMLEHRKEQPDKEIALMGYVDDEIKVIKQTFPVILETIGNLETNCLVIEK